MTEQPERRLDLNITPLRSLQVPTQVYCIPPPTDGQHYQPPVIRLTICGQKEGVGGSGGGQNGQSLKRTLTSYLSHHNLFGLGPSKRLGEHYSELVASASSLLRFAVQSALSAVTFLSTLLTFGAACCVYLLHLLLLNVHSYSAVGDGSLGGNGRRVNEAFHRAPPPPAAAAAAAAISGHDHVHHHHHHHNHPNYQQVHLLLGISFLSPGTIFCLSTLFIGPVLYVLASLVAMLTADVEHLFQLLLMRQTSLV